MFSKELLDEINYEYESNETKYFNQDLKDHEETIDVFDIPMRVNNDFIIGGCPREITFREVGFPVSDLNLYKIEKNFKDEYILERSIVKLYNGLTNKLQKEKYTIFHSLNCDMEDLIDTRRERLEPFRHSVYVYDKETKERTIMFYYLVQSDKKFKEPNDMIITDLMPGIINVMVTNDTKEIVVILKHVHSFEEKAISFTKSEYLDSEVLVINNVPTSFDIHKYNDLILDTVKDINKHIKNKTFSDVKNINKCNTCLHKRFCDTLP